MTDKETIKAFECCTKIEEGCGHEYCFKCPMFEEDVDECTVSLFGKVLDLIKRQQAEIEHFRDLTKKIKAEAYKEFAERLKRKLCSKWIYPVFVRCAINEVKKELTEGSK